MGQEIQGPSIQTQGKRAGGTLERANPVDEIVRPCLDIVGPILNLASGLGDPTLDRASVASQGAFAAPLEAIELPLCALRVAVVADRLGDAVANLENRPYRHIDATLKPLNDGLEACRLGCCSRRGSSACPLDGAASRATRVFG